MRAIIQIENILEENVKKVFFCFGGGTVTEQFLNEFLDRYEIKGIFDNDTSKHTKKICGIEIENPQHICNMRKGRFVVFILSRFVSEIKEQLVEFGLEEGKDFFDLFSIYKPSLRSLTIEKLHKNTDHLLEFIEKVPEGLFNAIPIKSEKNIGLVCIYESSKNHMCYMIAQALLLRYNGYNVTLIIDTLKAFESYYFYEGIEAVAREDIEKIISVLRKKKIDINIHYIEQEEEAELSERDRIHIKRHTKYNMIHFDADMEKPWLEGHPNRAKDVEKILEKTLKIIKAYFIKNHYDVVNVYSGNQRHYCNYTYIGRELGIRFSTYDMAEVGETLCSVEDAAGWSGDIEKVVKGNYFSFDEEEKIILLSKSNFETRKTNLVQDGKYNFQIVAYQDFTDTFDIVIPLNIQWDSAAIDRDNFFEDYLEWIKDTLQYIMENTKANVLLREHPAQNRFKNYHYVDLYKELPIIHQYKDRIHLALASEKINTYQCMEKCKMVLPYTSTTGIEAVLLDKNIILATNVYYDNIDIAYKAQDRQDYFEKISYYLNHSEEKICKNKRNAFLAYYYQMNNCFACDYDIGLSNWMDLTIEELNRLPGVKKIIESIAEAVPALYANVRETLSEK